ncbi:MAG: LruC domain-containing protein, partial [Bacteroidales bacterium]|nr:LruC domain-containing protein [Bacteroidales bacterium]
INNGVIATSFVGDAPSSSNASRSIAQAKMVDLNAAPYTTAEIADMLAVAHPFVSGKALDDATSYPMNYSGNSVTTIKLTGTYSGSFNCWYTYSTPSTVRLIITGTCTIADATQISKGVEIIVANGGKLIISPKKELTLNEKSVLTILQGGSVSGNKITCSADSRIYNGGSLALTGELGMNTSTLVNATGATYSTGSSRFSSENSIYNYGSFTTGSVSTMGNEIVNQQGATMTVTGTYEAESTTTTKGWLNNYGSFSANKLIGGGAVNIKNYCKLLVATDLETNELINGQSSYVECDTYKANNMGTVTLEANSIFKVKTSASLSATNFTGPTSGWALLKIKSISYGSIVQNGGNTKLVNGYIINNIHVEYADMTPKGVYWPNNGFDWLQVMINGNGNVNTTAAQNTQLVGNGNTDIALYGEAPLFIPAGDCTPGNTPTDYVPPVAVTPITYTYAFEDNFPNMGDYDFNDVVMDVKWDEIRNASNALTGITYHVTLVAVGATKELGAGLRLYDVNKSAISSITYGGDATNFQSTLSGVMFYPVANNLFEGNNSDAVIPLFGDAQKVLTGATNRTLMLNTSNNKVANAEPKTLDITITFNTPQATTPITKENLDFFIAYNTGKQVPTSRNEIHLYEFRDRQSAVGLDNSKYISAAANYPWAISVPEFRYPIERISIISAYEKFESWAQASKAERQQYEDWYKTISSDQKVFR